MSVVESHLQREARDIELLIARIRIGTIATGIAVGLVDLTFGGPRVIIAVLTLGAVWLGFAIAVLLTLPRVRARGPLGYAFTALDIVMVTLVSAAFAADPAFADQPAKSLAVLLYFFVIIMSGLRQSARLALFAGIGSAIGYVLLLVPTLIVDPGLILLRASPLDDASARGISLMRVLATAVALVLTGAIVSFGISRTRRLLTLALDTRSFVFADLRGYTGFIEQHGDRAAAALIDAFRRLVRVELARTGGDEIRTEGDSFYLVFTSATQALACAVGIQRQVQQANADRPDAPIDVGIGIHAGEPIPQDADYVGSAVNLAARLGQVAGPGEILASETVRDLVRTSEHPPMSPRDGLVLKGIAEPPRIYTVVWDAG